MNLDLLSELCETPGTSGREERIRALVRRELEPLCTEVEVDPLGNLIARRAGSGGPRVMLAAHMDEIGFMVTHIEEGGFLRVLPLGGFDPKTLSAQRVIVHGREDLLGVFGSRPVHIMTDEEKKQPPKLEDFFVDVGLPAERVRELVRRGDVVTRERGLTRLGDLLTGKSLDNRAGLYVMIEAMRALGEHRCEVVAVATVQEEVGLRGARVATGRVRPDVGLAIDITLANDGPAAKPHERITEVGAGAAIKVYDSSVIVPGEMVDHLVAVAQARDIPHQLELMTRGGTDTREVQLSGDGAIAGCVSIPTRYVHQVVETCHPDDLDACVALVAAFCETAHELVEAR
ncbi:MAG TPA: M42 family metallopeptidase [Miltoncostaeaceae bacterium]|nr:M42 family metallopeptidase [Miltoncostaeaceae bacterium]